MLNPKEFTKALKALEDTKNIPQEVVLEILIEALVNAYQKEIQKELKEEHQKEYLKEHGKEAIVRVDISPDNTKIEMFRRKLIVEEVSDKVVEISLEEAQEKNENYELGEFYEEEIKISDFARMAALHVKQMLKQKIREAEKQVVFDEYIGKKDDVIVGEVDRVEKNYTLINIGKTNALLPASHYIPGEVPYKGQHLKVYVNEVVKSGNGAQVVVSRTAPGFLKRLFESEIMEVYDGTVEIRAIAREPGERAKVAVSSKDKNVDAAGACIGQKGIRIQKITAQIANEKIDVINYYDEIELFIAEALKPANVHGMALNHDEKSAIVVVPNEEFSLAIGRKGQNARLAVKLTKWKIDIKSVDDAYTEQISYTQMQTIINNYLKAEEVEEIDVVDVYEDKAEEIEVIEEVEPEVLETPKEEVVGEEPKVEKPKKVELQEKIEVILEPKTDGLKPQIEIEMEKAAAEQKAAQQAAERKARSKKETKEEAKEDEKVADVQHMPVYTEEELKALEEAESETDADDYYDEDIDYDDYDEYYD